MELWVSQLIFTTQKHSFASMVGMKNYLAITCTPISKANNKKGTKYLTKEGKNESKKSPINTCYDKICEFNLSLKKSALYIHYFRFLIQLLNQ
jgi:hypothetical protein